MERYPIDQYLHEAKSVMLYAAKLWAEVRQSGQATAYLGMFLRSCRFRLRKIIFRNLYLKIRQLVLMNANISISNNDQDKKLLLS